MSNSKQMSGIHGFFETGSSASSRSNQLNSPFSSYSSQASQICTPTTPVSKDGQKMYTIQGVRVYFPYKAYPSQLAMMDRILKGLHKRENCLLESPTGSGKSVTLLCACIAWQQKEKERVMKELEERLKAQMEAVNAEINSASLSVPQTPGKTESERSVPSSYFDLSSTPANSSTAGTPAGQNTEDSEDFQPAKRKKIRNNKPVPLNDAKTCLADAANISGSATNVTIKKPSESPIKASGDAASSCCSCSSSKCDLEPDTGSIHFPKIYFGTRTHKQIAQIVRELGRTAYKNTRMCILSSRQNTCIHSFVSHSDNRNEACKELLDNPNGPQCPYYLNARRVSHSALECSNISIPWNIEDLVKFGKKTSACPYFAIRELMTDADIIFCPYNYLIDPIIRTTMEISLKGDIVVLDEAHNIEDSARDAASWSVTQHQLLEAMHDLESSSGLGFQPSEAHKIISSLLSGLVNWIARNSENFDFHEFDRSGKIWNGIDFIAVLKDINAGPEAYQLLRKAFQDVLTIEMDQESPSITPLSSTTVKIIKELQIALNFLYRLNMKFVPDYKVVIIRTNAKWSTPVSSKDVWLKKEESPWTYTLNLWCLNPAVAFSDFKDKMHNLIVTSGTLSPMVSFQSELNMPFNIQLEANHVISDSQVWIGTVRSGPQGGILNASYKFAETFTFQDEIGSLVLQICQAVPHGVLCFFPSYSMLNKLMQRWKLTGLWNNLEEHKVVISEPRSSDRVSLDSVMVEFYKAIEGNEYNGSSITGALFLAVFRGKVSEGLDFADNNARAVITVGIPFPNVKDIQINLKRQYNNHYSSERSLLPGSQWYEIQAFRALNQALGRCIRHKDDWGALILVDNRFQKNPMYSNGLSKWVRRKLRHYPSFPPAISSLKEFMDSKISTQTKEAANVSILRGIEPINIDLDEDDEF